MLESVFLEWINSFSLDMCLYMKIETFLSLQCSIVFFLLNYAFSQASIVTVENEYKEIIRIYLIKFSKFCMNQSKSRKMPRINVWYQLH